MSDKEKGPDGPFIKDGLGGNDVHNQLNSRSQRHGKRGQSDGGAGRWRFPLVLAAVAAVGILLGAGVYLAFNLRNGEPNEPAVTAPIDTPAPPPKAEVYCPLCGAAVDSLPTGRPLAVMIDNLVAARPQSGLESADLVYEAPAEGGITRLMPVFYHQKPGKIGPIRSARPYFITLAREHQAVYIHCGGSSDALTMLKNKSIASINEFGASKYFWRSPQRKEPHNLYSSSEMLEQAVNDRKMQKEVKMAARQFLQPDAVTAGVLAESFNIDYGINSHEVRYVYDAAEKVYKRFQGGSPQKDADSGRQLAAANVIVQQVSGKVLDDEGRMQLGVTGSGKATVYTGGKKIEATWSKSSAEARTVYKDQQGAEVALAPGTTWVQLATPSVRVY